MTMFKIILHFYCPAISLLHQVCRYRLTIFQLLLIALYDKKFTLDKALPFNQLNYDKAIPFSDLSGIFQTHFS